MTGDIGAHVTILRLGEFDTTSVGGGVQASWNLTLSHNLIVNAGLDWRF